MCRQVFRYSVFAFMAGVVMIASTSDAFSGWEVDTQPEIPGNLGIASGGNMQEENGTIVIQKGEKIKLAAVTRDQDKYTVSDTPDTFRDDTPKVIWTCSGGGSLQRARSDSGQSNEFTAPNTTGTITITAQADDAPTLANDDPGETVTLNIKVVDGCPASIGMSSQCTGTPNWYTAQTFGLLATKMCVAGGTPPNPPGNWNGLQITETVGFNATDTTCTQNDINMSLDSPCKGNSTFTVGSGAPTMFDCQGPQADNCCYDLHGSNYPTLALKAGHGPCNIVCNQEYFCNGTSLGKFKVTRHYELIDIAPWGTRCQITVTKTAN